MLRYVRIAVLLTLAVSFERLAFACKCAGSSSACEAFATADLLFAGRVESIDPAFDPWDRAFTRRLADLFPGRNLYEIHSDADLTPETLAKMKNLYASVFPEPVRSRIRNAQASKDLGAVLENVFDQGKRVHFRVDQAYKGIPAQQSGIDIWTDFSDCGERFQQGETYLVYATKDKDGRFGTGACSRTQRLTNAGADLAYLFVREHGGRSNGRVYGFLTSNELDLRTPRYWDFVNDPVADLEVELRPSASSPPRLTETDQEGRFVFDGLAPGEYELVVLDPNSKDIKQIGNSRHVKIQESACHAEVLYVPKSFIEKK